MSGIYIHIPFCRQACHYCDFHFSTELKMKDQFVDALLTEIKLRSEYLGKGSVINTVYLGGGTPSLLEQKDLEHIFSELHVHFTVSEEAEITLEANPDDLTKTKLNMLANTPVNRLSIGIQSFDDEELTWMNRAHNAKMAIECVYDANDAGINNISIDLIYGSPLLTNSRWIKNLDTAFSLPVQHLSCYNLTIENKTALADMIKKGKRKPPDELKSKEQFKILMELTAINGFDQYEISNFSKNNRISLHNSSYWNGTHYLGLGPSAHSFNGISRQWNLSNNQSYIKAMKAGMPLFTTENLTAQDKYNEYIMTSLRTKWGVEIRQVREKFGSSIERYLLERLTPHISSKHIIKNETNYMLSDEGKYFADGIASDLFFIGNKSFKED